ncbi:MAG: abortive infection system antitoxin AbiGi family protein [Gallionellaceae bacterium]
MANGFWPKYCQEDFKWYNPETGLISYPMVCFCDIPLTRIDAHVKFYGSYGLGLTKQWAMSNKLSPVIYIPNDTRLSNALTRMLRKGAKPQLEYYKKVRKMLIQLFRTSSQ